MICQKYFIRQLSFFGSTIHWGSSSDSDLDILVEFLRGRTPGFAYVTLQLELSDLLQWRVDLHTPGSLSRYFGNSVLREAQIVCAQRGAEVSWSQLR